MRIELYVPGEAVKDFQRLASAMQYAAAHKVTGTVTIITGDSAPEVINIRKGKRPGAKPGTWVSCLIGYGVPK